MKTLVNYISESIAKIDNRVNQTLVEAIKSTLSKFDWSKIKEWDENDKNKFVVQKQNEAEFIGNFPELNNLRAISTIDYYNLINKDGDFEKLSDSEKSDFDAKNGDIIVIDNDNNPIYCIDLKLSNNYVGAISYGSLCKFGADNKTNAAYIYVCAKIGSKDCVVVDHDAVYNAVVDNPELLNEPSENKKYKGYEIDGKLGKKLSECYVKGIDIKKIFK